MIKLTYLKIMRLSLVKTGVFLFASSSLVLHAGDANSQPIDSAGLRLSLSGPDREVTDFIRDEIRKPVEVLSFLGLEFGDTVMDLYAAGGYYTFILSKAVGPEGTVYAQNTARGRRFIEDRQEITQGQALDLKIERGKLTNVVQIVRPLADLDIPENSLDLVMVAQVLHDYYNPNTERALEMLLAIKKLLKSGGVIGITDHVGIERYDNDDLHRMQISQAIEIAEKAGFIVEQSDILRVRGDDHSRSIFDPRLNRSTDRFLLRLTKP